MRLNRNHWIPLAVTLSFGAHLCAGVAAWLLGLDWIVQAVTFDRLPPQELRKPQVILLSLEGDVPEEPQATIQLTEETQVDIAPTKVTLFGRKLVPTSAGTMQLRDVAPEVERVVAQQQSRKSANRPEQEETPVRRPTRKTTRRKPRSIQVSTRTESLDLSEPVYSTSVEYDSNPIPVYVRSWANQGIQGRVWVEATFESSGKVRHVRIVKSSGFDVLDGSVVTAVKSWRAKPKLVGGRPIVHKTVIKFHFRPR